MLRTLNSFVTLIVVLITFFLGFAPVTQAQEVGPQAEASNREINLVFAATPDDTAVHGRSWNPEHYKVAVFEEGGCPGTLGEGLTTFYEMSLAHLGDPANTAVLQPGRYYTVASYHRVDAETWAMTPNSCKQFEPTLPGPDLAYQPLVTYIPPVTAFFMDVEVKLPAMVKDYYLVRQKGDVCTVELTTPLANDVAAIEFDGSSDRTKQHFVGGHWTMGIYHKTQVLIAAGGAKVEHDRYSLVGKTCQAFAVADFDGRGLYQPVLPKRVLAPATVYPSAEASAEPAPSEPKLNQLNWFVSAGASTGLEGENASTVGPLFRGGFRLNGLVAVGSFGVQIVPIPMEAASFRPTFSGSLGYAKSYLLPQPNKKLLKLLPSTFAWHAAVAAGWGSFQANCGPETFDVSEVTSTVTCGHGEGFPLRIVAPWFGPELATRLLWPTHSQGRKPTHVGVDFTFTPEMYVVATDGWPRFGLATSGSWGRTTTVHTSEGDREVTFMFESDPMVWVVPKLGAAVVLMW